MVGFPAIFLLAWAFRGVWVFNPHTLSAFRSFGFRPLTLSLFRAFALRAFGFRPLTLSFILLFPFCFLFLEGLDVGLFGGGAVEVAVELFG